MKSYPPIYPASINIFMKTKSVTIFTAVWQVLELERYFLFNLFKKRVKLKPRVLFFRAISEYLFCFLDSQILSTQFLWHASSLIQGKIHRFNKLDSAVHVHEIHPGQTRETQ